MRARELALRLTERDVALLGYLAEHKAAPIDVLAGRFFTNNPFTGAANKDPRGACVRRLSALRRAGYLRDGNQLVYLTPNGARAAGKTPPRSVHARAHVHHAQTMRAAERVKKDLEADGYKVKFHLENEIRGLLQTGKRTRRGERFDAFPDALLVAQRPDGTTLNIALEYVTQKYTDELIREKAREFARAYDKTLWIGDIASTLNRVERLTGAGCEYP